MWKEKCIEQPFSAAQLPLYASSTSMWIIRCCIVCENMCAELTKFAMELPECDYRPKHCMSALSKFVSFSLSLSLSDCASLESITNRLVYLLSSNAHACSKFLNIIVDTWCGLFSNNGLLDLNQRKYSSSRLVIPYWQTFRNLL